ncbi:MAG TPA: ferric reductase-like transmembrane domain-containing protein, partial [Gaiellaceae bacterium]
MTALTWYVARSAGIVAYLLMSTSVVLGVLMSARAKFTWPRFAVEEVHRFLAILTGVFLFVHGLALFVDQVVPISFVQLVIPFQTAYRPFGVGLGITSALLLLAISISNLLRKRMPFRFWRRIHYVTLAVWLTATAHGLLAGTDRQDFWFLALVGVAVCTVALAFLGRFASTVTLGTVGGVAATAVVAVLALAFSPQPKPPHRTTATVAAPLARTVPASFTGTLAARVLSGASSPVLSVVGHAGGAGLRVDLLVNQGQVEQTSLALNFPTGASCHGTVTALASDGLRGSCGS